MPDLIGNDLRLGVLRNIGDLRGGGVQVKAFDGQVIIKNITRSFSVRSYFPFDEPEEGGLSAARAAAKDDKLALVYMQ